ncbi:hypothetical protein VPFG_00175 [Vibrio phage nt-1]|uniref:Uncharacterized protein n=1 Tax=Vibrio phage nt-1 TaxID=115992 RepID=R9TJB0_9CAUD|nr:hypothetical protein VPFG_00175 [Vibrio phage nt-1]AGN30177.1 hypothetical protein VPFG_00175 [Vibrio phage nt-1]
MYNDPFAELLRVGQWIVHKKTGNVYTVMGKGKLKFDGKWYDAVTYSNELGDVYTRTYDDFRGFELNCPH